ncbi:MAG: LacI family DNA-binding transcriptional regulator [Cyclobacteriaceae bacterium]
MKSYTIKDIAKLAEVSPGTVDRVIHNRGKVSEKALVKVKAVLEEIDYEPNVLAQSLKNQKILLIEVLMPHIHEDEYWKQIHEGIQAFSQQYKGFGLKISVHHFSSLDPSSFVQVANEALKRGVDAFLITPLFLNESIAFEKELQRQGIPLITINNEINDIKPLTFIGQNLIESSRTAANLIAQCSKDLKDIIIIHISEDPFNASYLSTKAQGVRDYFKGKGVDIHEITLNNPENDIQNLIQMSKDLSPNPGYFITTSKAHLVAAELRRHSPNSVIVGYDLIHQNIDLLVDHKINFLINQNPYKMAFEGLAKFADKLVFSRSLEPHYYLPIDIINSENIHSYIK